MRPEVLIPLALLFIAQGVPSSAQNAAEESRVAVDEGAPLTVECALRVQDSAEWRLDGAAPPADLRPVPEAAAAGGRLTARLRAAAARAQHAGVYTCARPPAQRVRVLVRPKPRAVPGESAGEAAATTTAAAPPPERAAAAAAAAAATADAAPIFYYDVGRPLELNCTKPRADSANGYVWTVNGTTLTNRYELQHEGTVLVVKGKTQEDDFGRYACTAGGVTQSWDVRGRPHAKLALNTNVVEGQKLKLVCKVIGKPYPAVQWTYNVTVDNVTDVAEALGGRAVLQRSEQGVEGAQLVLEEAARGDAGQYTCRPAGGVAAATVLRVKGMYAALWPFLGICAEVFVLCAIILVYEKRRTKPELDDSDTDNHDQKKS